MLFFIALRVTINEQKLYVFRLYYVILKKTIQWDDSIHVYSAK